MSEIANENAKSQRSSKPVASADEVAAILDGITYKASVLRKLARFFSNNEHLVKEFLTPLFDDNVKEIIVQRTFALLSMINNKPARRMLARHGIQSSKAARQLAALNTISVSQVLSSPYFITLAGL